MNKIAFVLLSVVIVLAVFVALILGKYWIIALPPAFLIGYWIAGPTIRKKREEEEIEKLKEIARKL